MATRKQRGYDTQRLIAGWFAENGWPFAESAGAGRSGSDVTGMPGLDVEVKARRGLDLPALIKQMLARSRENRELVSFGVVRPDGYGPAKLPEFPVVVPLEVWTRVLRQAGYGEPLPDEVSL